jgi:NADH dehydrogenase FAD-containing subunit
MSTSNKQTIVIIGSGSGGALAHTLAPKLDASKHELILISPLPYYLLLLPALRMIVTPEGNLNSTEKAKIPLDNLFPPGVPGRHIQGLVMSVEEKNVILEDGTTVDYDILVLATGSKWTRKYEFFLEMF